jgi:predicted ester cyclase
MATRDHIIARYRRYLDACNRRAWDELGTFVADTVVVNGVRRTRAEYVADVRVTCETFPDYQWDLVRAIVERDWLAVHLRDTGTRVRPFLGAPGDGSRVETQEFDMYLIQDGLIHEVEGTADNARLRA